MDEVEPEATEEELLAEAGQLPFGLACCLGHLSRLSLSAHLHRPPRLSKPTSAYPATAAAVEARPGDGR
jgi:hypothetical protein